MSWRGMLHGVLPGMAFANGYRIFPLSSCLQMKTSCFCKPHCLDLESVLLHTLPNILPEAKGVENHEPPHIAMIFY